MTTTTTTTTAAAATMVRTLSDGSEMPQGKRGRQSYRLNMLQHSNLAVPEMHCCHITGPAAGTLFSPNRLILSLDINAFTLHNA